MLITRPVLDDTRIDAIDELRGLAFLVVLASHIGLAYGLDSSVAYGLALPAFGVGVDLFFVISGYVVASSFGRLLTEAGGNWKIATTAFWLRRSIRIALPAWFIVIAITLARRLAGDSLASDELVAAATFTANFYWASCSTSALPCPDQMVAGHFWSLALEMQFYLATPLLLLAPRRAVLPICFVIVIAGVIIPRPVGGWLWSIRPEGFLLGLALRRISPALPPMSLTLAVYWLAVASIFERIAQRSFSGIGLTMTAMIFAYVVASRRNARPPSHRAVELLRAIGRSSYAAYLVHLPILTAVRHLTIAKLGPDLSMIVGLAVIGVASLAVDILVVRPTARWSRRISDFIITNCAFVEPA